MTTSGVVRWGILGPGRIAVRFARSAATAAGAQLVAVASRTPGRAAEFASTFGIERVHPSYEALLADPGVDAVYIAGPNSVHHPLTMQALGAGKHVLCEKPYSRRAADVVEAFDAADAAGLILMEAFMWRHSPQARRFVELLPGIGELQSIRGSFSFSLDNPDDVRLRADLDGGSLMDVGCYCVSGSRLFAAAEPEAVFGDQVVGPSGVDLRFAGLLRFPSGVLATVSCGFTSETASIEAVGTRGTLALRSPWLGDARVLSLDGREIEVTPDDPYRLEAENMSAAIRGEAAPLLGRADALGQARTIEALYRSAASGVAVRPGA